LCLIPSVGKKTPKKPQIYEIELVLWEEKQDWQILNQTKQKKEKNQINEIR
jgi:hypothetical protein